jgi:short-subunit dehydrogenase
MKRIVIVGATSRIAEHCARRWVQQGPAHVVLVGRDPARLEVLAQDLRVRGNGAVVQVRSVDFERPEAIAGLVRELEAEGAIDVALIAHGSLPDQAACQADLALAAAALSVNGLSPVLFA